MLQILKVKNIRKLFVMAQKIDAMKIISSKDIDSCVVWDQMEKINIV